MNINFNAVLSTLGLATSKTRLIPERRVVRHIDQDEELIAESHHNYPQLTSAQSQQLWNAVDRYFKVSQQSKEGGSGSALRDARVTMAKVYKEVGFKNPRAAFMDFLDTMGRKTLEPLQKAEITAVMNVLVEVT